MNNKPIIEPDFEGEVMKIPENLDSNVTNTEPTTILNGPILILLVAILLALLGGIYYWYTILMSDPIIPQTTSLRSTPETNNEPESTTAEARTSALDVVSTSDEIDAIGADIESLPLEPLDADFAAIENELESALNKPQTTP